MQQSCKLDCHIFLKKDWIPFCAWHFPLWPLSNFPVGPRSMGLTVNKSRSDKLRSSDEIQLRLPTKLSKFWRYFLKKFKSSKNKKYIRQPCKYEQRFKTKGKNIEGSPFDMFSLPLCKNGWRTEWFLEFQSEPKRLLMEHFSCNSC